MFIVYGFFIGVAELIPGVSGSTIAAILGIYERIIRVIGGINLKFIKRFLNLMLKSPFSKENSKRFIGFLKEKDLFFLLQILIGDLASILILSGVFTYFLTVHREIIYGFFTGLIVASLYFFIKGAKKVGLKEALVIIICILGLICMAESYNSLERFNEESGFYQSILANDSKMFDYQKKELLVIFFSGILAAAALILPGISGSFVLLLLGKYLPVISSLNFVRNALMEGKFPFFEILYLAFFICGILIGVLLMSKVIHVLLTRYRSLFDAFIIGLLTGSLYIIWPFKKFVFVDGYIKAGDSFVFKSGIKLYLSENKNLFEIFSSHSTVLPMLSLALGIFFIFLVHYLGKRHSQGELQNKV